jgi:hypothetical protein
MDSRKTGLSNPVAKDEGFPTSGEMSANAGTLPAQRAQEPFEQTRAQTNMPTPTAKPPEQQQAGGGTLNGGAVKGAQYKVSAQPMSASVASFVSIPTGIGGAKGFTPPPPPSVPGATPISLNMNQQPQFFAAQGQGQSQQQQSQQQGATPASAAAQNPPQPSQPAQPQQPMPSPAPAATTAPAPTAGATNNMPTPTVTGAPNTSAMPLPGESQYDYDKRMSQMGSYYDIGSGYDKQQQALMAEQIRQQNMAAWQQNQLAGRGGNIAQVAQNYANTMAALQSDADRAAKAQAAHQGEFANRMAYNQAVASTKMDMVKMANELGFDLSDEDYNQMASEIVSSYGGNVGPGTMAAKLKEAATSKANPKMQSAREHNISSWLNHKSPREAGESMSRTFAEMSDKELADFFRRTPQMVVNAMSYVGMYDRSKAEAIKAKLDAALAANA